MVYHLVVVVDAIAEAGHLVFWCSVSLVGRISIKISDCTLIDDFIVSHDVVHSAIRPIINSCTESGHIDVNLTRT